MCKYGHLSRENIYSIPRVNMDTCGKTFYNTTFQYVDIHDEKMYNRPGVNKGRFRRILVIRPRVSIDTRHIKIHSVRHVLLGTHLSSKFIQGTVCEF